MKPELLTPALSLSLIHQESSAGIYFMDHYKCTHWKWYQEANLTFRNNSIIKIQQPILWTASHLRSTSTTPALTSREDARVHECGHTEVSQNKQEDDSIVDRHSDWETLWEPRAAVIWTETTVLTLQGSVTLYGSAGMSLTLWAQEDKPTCWSYKLRIAITR